MNKTIATILLAAMLTIILPGCSAKELTPAQTTTPPEQSEPIEPIAPADEQTGAAETPVAAAETPVAAAETPAADIKPESALTEFKSDFGYTISYVTDDFDYRRTEGYDEYCLKSDDMDKPFVFICVSSVGAEFVGQMKAAALGESPEACTIGKEQMQAQCSETKEAWDGGEIIRKTYVYTLNTGDALLIETQRYTEQADDPYAALLLEMVNSIVL